MPSKRSSAVGVNSNVGLRRSTDRVQQYELVAIEDHTGDDATSASETDTGMSLASGDDANKEMYKIQSLSTIELKAFEAVKKGDLESIQEILSANEFLEQGDINNTDKCGFTILHYAVIHQYEHIVEFLLKQENIFAFDTLYYAILEENIDIVMLLIDFTKANANRLQGTPERDSDFPRSTTPLVLACKIGSLSLIELFYKGGDRLNWCNEDKSRASLYHDECICNMCIGPKGLEDDYERLSLWQAFCNPVYISFMSGERKDFDPIQEAFFLLKLLKEQVIPIEPVFTVEYEELAKKLEKYTVDMLGMCRNTYETDLMLSAPRDDKECAEKYPRLRWALDLQNVDFVIHPHTQTCIYKWWAGDGWPAWIGMHPALKFLHFLTRLILFVPVSILLLFDRESTMGKFFSTPVNIFLNSLAAYIFFLILLVVQISYPYQRCNTEDNFKDDLECTSKGPPQIGTEWVIILYVFGFLLNSAKHFWPAKKRFFRYKWNVWNLVAQLSFIVAFICWAISYFEWIDILYVTGGVPPVLPRHLWSAYDPILISEAFFALGTMLSVGKMLQYVQVEPKLGPLQTGLGRVIHKFFTTGVYFLFVLFAFSSGLSGNYKGYLNIKDEQGNEVATKVKEDFADFFGTTKNLYFGLFGVYDKDALTIELDDIVLANGTSVPNHHWANQLVGKCMAVAFHLFAVIMMMSVLTGFLFSAFGEAQENELKTWKYTRTEVYLYFGLETAIPSPFNLLTFLNMYYFSRCSKKTAIASRCTMKSCCFYQTRETKQEAKKRRSQYFQLMNKLRLQYVELVQSNKDEEPASADDVKEINEELEQLKALMQEKGLKAPEESKMQPPEPQPSTSRGLATTGSREYSRPGMESPPRPSKTQSQVETIAASKSVTTVPTSSKSGIPGISSPPRSGPSASTSKASPSVAVSLPALPPKASSRATVPPPTSSQSAPATSGGVKLSGSPSKTGGIVSSPSGTPSKTGVGISPPSGSPSKTGVAVSSPSASRTATSAQPTSQPSKSKTDLPPPTQ